MKMTFTKNLRLFLCISGAIIAVALILQICGLGLNLGIDFTGGSILEYSVGENYDVADVEKILSAAGYADAQITKAAPSAASEMLQENLTAEAPTAEETADETAEETAEEAAEETGEAAAETAASILDMDKSGVVADGLTDLQVRLRLADDDTTEVRAALEREMGAKYENFHFVSIDHVSAIAGRDLIANAVKALLVAFALMLVYIAIRFDPMSGLAALFGLLHDVLIMCAFMVFFRAFFQVNSPFIAAVLTIVGYSINNTIIIFDRIRENGKKPGLTQAPKMEIVEKSVSNTLSRTVNTTLTTMITLVALYVFGVESIREFAFPLIVGMLAGTYSSVLLSGQVWAVWSQKLADRKAAAKAAEKNA